MFLTKRTLETNITSNQNSPKHIHKYKHTKTRNQTKPKQNEKKKTPSEQNELTVPVQIVIMNQQ